ALSIKELLVKSRCLNGGTLALTLICILGLPGCSKETQEFAEVDGTVTLNGKPLPNVEVVFMSELQNDKGKANPASMAYTDDRGTSSLWCSQADVQGAVPGTYRVVINDTAAMPMPPLEFGDNPAAAKAYRPGPLRVPSKYSGMAQTPFRDIKVTSGHVKLDF